MNTDNSNTPTVRGLIKKALLEATLGNWHEVWRLCKSELRFWLDHEFAKGDIKLTEEDFTDLDEILSLLGEFAKGDTKLIKEYFTELDETLSFFCEEYKTLSFFGEETDELDKKCFIHPTFVKREVTWVIEKARELLTEEVEEIK